MIVLALAIGSGGCTGRFTPAMTEAAPAANAQVTPWVSVEEIQGGEALIVKATIKSIDVESRTLWLKDPSGAWTKLRVDPSVRDFDHLRAGEFVVARYYEDTVLELRKGGASGGAAGSIEIGRLPIGVAGLTRSLVGKVTHVNRTKPSATVQLAEGEKLEVRVKDPAMLHDVKIGDRVEVTVLEARAVAVDKGVPATRD